MYLVTGETLIRAHTRKPRRNFHVRQTLRRRPLLLAGSILTAGAATVPGGLRRTADRHRDSPARPALTVLPDGARARLAAKTASYRIIKGDVLLAANFWGVPNVDSTNERGCLGIVPDPQFATTTSSTSTARSPTGPRATTASSA
jgi:hypothetical protein